MAGINDLDELQKHSDGKGFRSFSAELSFVPLFNLALQQNALPVAHELKLLNHLRRIRHLGRMSKLLRNQQKKHSLQIIIPQITVILQKKGIQELMHIEARAVRTTFIS